MVALYVESLYLKKKPNMSTYPGPMHAYRHSESQCLKWFKKAAGSLDFFHVKMMHFGVFCVQFHRPRARMNKISNVLESIV